MTDADRKVLMMTVEEQHSLCYQKKQTRKPPTIMSRKYLSNIQVCGGEQPPDKIEYHAAVCAAVCAQNK